MNKKILTVLLVLAMMLSMVAPMAVFAEKACTHSMKGPADNYNGTHNIICYECGYVFEANIPCTYDESHRCTCGSSDPNWDPDAPAECKHASVVCTDNGDGTHKETCSNPDCDGFVVNKSVPHTFKDGVCEACGAKEPTKCEHTKMAYVVVDDMSHEVRCADCSKTMKQWEAHEIEDGKCTKCGYEEPVEPCKHEHTIWNWDEETETHYLLCQDCEKALTEPEACTYGEDGKCTVCGGLKKACEHEHTHIVDNEDQTHSLVCDECDLVLETEPCVYVNGKCVICKSKQPAKCEHTNKIYTPVKDGKTHEVSCADCGETLKKWEAHDFVDHKCTKCGFEEPVEPCKHEHTIWVWNEGDGTHYLLCEDCADILTDPEACTYEDGVCTVCGGLENTLPDPDLDDVPKTGSFFLEWLYSVIF